MKNDGFHVGQRWLSNTETELGLGAIISVDFRTVEIFFPATGETRRYAKNEAPLTRLIYAVGDRITHTDEWLATVTEVNEKQGVLVYEAIREDTKESVTISEALLSPLVQLNEPEQRLFNNQLDLPKWFDLRLQALEHDYAYQQSSTIGLAGARIELIPHQLHIAAEVGKRYAPRVLLSDEVGLGKTIEAALIIHQQLQTGRSQRVLIIVPDSLVHQWLVEMLRRVNLHFSVFDQSRCAASSEDGTNPFDDEQLVLCSLDFLVQHPRHHQQALDSNWDMLVVDEAHHLGWSEAAPSTEYSRVEALANAIPSVLLLTATPDQLGHQSHFARLRLLDPARFVSYEAFLAEEATYAKVAEAVTPLLEDAPLTEQHIEALQSLAPDIAMEAESLKTEQERLELAHKMIDLHGTGRILFRNRRANIEGFPSRKLDSQPLNLPIEYADIINSAELTDKLFPERHASVAEAWVDFDPRVEWLMAFLTSIKPAKVLLICASATTAQQLAEVLRTKSGIRHSVFHEGMSIVDRDKAAHYFADPEAGAQVLLCSEIGSEGRNFQFAHHLVLFDLPLTPDLLEQRIGRLDRIGQTRDVQIHVPYLIGSAQQVLLDWYNQGLDAFCHTCPTGSGVFEEVAEQLLAACHSPTDIQLSERLIADSQQLNASLKKQLDEGRDRLLELNASGTGKVDPLLEDMVALDTSLTLANFMSRVFDAIGIHQEEKGHDCFILTPTESMVNHLPGFDHEGMTVTYRRRVATTLEHVHFLTWDHPLVHSAIELVLTELLGKSSVGFIADSTKPAGIYWLESLFVLECSAPKALQAGRYLPPTPLRICLDAKGQPAEISFADVRPAGKKVAQQLVGALKAQLETQISRVTALAHTQANKVLQGALTTMRESLSDQAERLQSLQKRNPAVRDEEIEFVNQQMTALEKALTSADVRLDALRVVVNNP
ncbi:RNA polymerase-associated protein RapA [Alteromonas sp. ASW11-130]|uniref:RNA polymerase-associated protein RapA n=1 Tax=Alteromonas sp. ASW11-130 TaxID=3015775 RepID=UPI002242A9E5|nr:RNA polymerase-associated protein RapA [Alteromonas sp. ASW11-130]MCW8091844.1 RNA polymerase-associated protein RapA [Alteromonas sp. ASW11-130]